MGVKFWDSYCPDKPTPPHAHHWVAIGQIVDRGLIHQCKYCGRHIWLPVGWSGAESMTTLIRSLGVEKGYRKLLAGSPVARKLLAKLQDIDTLRITLPDEMYLKVVAAIMVDKEYPYEEVGDEQEGYTCSNNRNT